MILTFGLFYVTACRSDNVIEKQENTAPTITITSHNDGAEVRDGFVESFRAAVSDADNDFDELRVAWYVGEEIICDSLAFKVAGPLFATRSDITTITRTGQDTSVAILLEEGTADFEGKTNGDGNFFRLVQESGSAASNDSDGRNAEGKTLRTDPIVVETSLNDAATLSQTGTSSGTANILKGVDVAAA